MGGYSTIWFAKAVAPLGGKVTTLEVSEEHAKVVRENIKNARFESVVEVKVGKVLETLEEFKKSGEYMRGGGKEFGLVFKSEESISF